MSLTLHERVLQRFPYLRREDALGGFWYFHAVADSRLCWLCDWYSGIVGFSGAVARGMFPFMEIVDDDLIQVNVHPNCRCYLTREP